MPRPSRKQSNAAEGTSRRCNPRLAAKPGSSCRCARSCAMRRQAPSTVARSSASPSVRLWPRSSLSVAWSLASVTWRDPTMLGNLLAGQQQADLLEMPADRAPAADQQRLHGGYRNPQHFGALGAAHLVGIAQSQRGALAGRQRLHGAGNLALELAAGGMIGGAARGADLALELLGGGGAAFAAAIDREIDDDAAKPGPEGAARRLPLIGVEPDAHQRLLQHVVGVGAIVKHAVSDGETPFAVFQGERLERVLLP